MYSKPIVVARIDLADGRDREADERRNQRVVEDRGPGHQKQEQQERRDRRPEPKEEVAERDHHFTATMPAKLYHLKNTSTSRKPAPSSRSRFSLEPVRDQHVLERLALLRDLELAVAVAALERVIALDEEPVEHRAVAEHLLDHSRHAVLVACRA